MDRLKPYNELPDLPPGEIQAPDTGLLKKLNLASRALAELKGLCYRLPDPLLLVRTIALQESRESSEIENIVTTQEELYSGLIEPEKGNPASKEVLRYREALLRGTEWLREGNDLLTTNLFIRLVQEVKGNTAGIRNQQGTVIKDSIDNKVIYTPPCCENEIRNKLGSLEEFIHDQRAGQLDPLLKLPLIHYQFEAIHPFFDGNGRVGRIINVLYLVQQGLLDFPVLYLSRYINRNRREYYRLLREVTETGSWEDWVRFILTAVINTSESTRDMINEVWDLMKVQEQEMKEILGSSYSSALLDLAFSLPYLTINAIVQKEIAVRQTASNYLKALEEAGLYASEKKGKTTYYKNIRLIELLRD